MFLTNRTTIIDILSTGLEHLDSTTTTIKQKQKKHLFVYYLLYIPINTY